MYLSVAIANLISSFVGVLFMLQMGKVTISAGDAVKAVDSLLSLLLEVFRSNEQQIVQYGMEKYTYNTSYHPSITAFMLEIIVTLYFVDILFQYLFGLL